MRTLISNTVQRWKTLLGAGVAVWLGMACGGGGAMGGDIVLQWNIYARETMKRDSAQSNPGWSGRTLAMMNGAIYDCFQAIHRTHEPFRVDVEAGATASKAAAATEAAYRILLGAYPGESSWLLWAYSYNLSLIPNGEAKAAGVALGRMVADEYLGWREGDGSEDTELYEPSGLAGRWRPDPLNPTQEAWGPGWGKVKTFALENSGQFPVPPPPALTSEAYEEAFEEVRDYGSGTSLVRTEDQLRVGLFWAYDRSGLGPPPVLFLRNLHEIAVQRGNTEAENARLFAMASVALADAATAAWDAKFADDFWRPITAIREAETDGNPRTAAEATWVPQGCPGGGIVPNFTPSFPAYPSGHATMGEAVYSVLQAFYGTDAMEFTLTSDELPGHVRSYTALSQAAQENADSRVWLGVHWRFDQTAGQDLGRSVGEYVAETFFAPVAVVGEDLSWRITGPESGVGYTAVSRPGGYAINGRFDVTIGSEFLRQLTAGHAFTILTSAGPLVGQPVNAVQGRLATADGYGSFRVEVSEQAVTLDDFQLAPGIIETFASFAASHGLSGQMETDADGDGRSDFEEYALGTDPRVRDSAPTPVLETIEGQKILVLRYLRRPGRELAGLYGEVQQSADLADWNTDGVTDTVDPEAAPVAGAEPRRAWIPVMEGESRFIRMWARQE
ncbi:MAG: phosphatase PAP2 family protein [Verrucomicrobiales bacterium]